MYIQGSPQYKYHVEHYGHPSKFGYKDVIPLWKAERWEPEDPDPALQKGGCQVFRGARLALRQLRLLELQTSPLELRELRPKERCRGDCGGRPPGSTACGSA